MPFSFEVFVKTRFGSKVMILLRHSEALVL
jgi:hypothetical protein